MHSHTLKLEIISALTSFAFWIPIITVFLHAREISDTNIYLLITIYSFSVVLLEYPTGVIGDYFSHKTSATLGYLILGLADFLVAIKTNDYSLFLTFLIITALGMTMVSGSDAAYRYNLLGDQFKKEYPKIKMVGTFATLLGIISGPFLYNISPILPFIVNGICFLLAVVVMQTLPKPQTELKMPGGDGDNIFSLAKLGIKNITSSKILPALIAFSAVIAALAINMKWIYPTLFTRELLPLTVWGILISSFYLARMLGTYYYKKLFREKQRSWYLIALVASLVFLGIPLGQIGLYVALFVEFFLVGILETDIDVLLQEAAHDKVRASVLSFTSLVERLFSGAHIALLGFMATGSNFLTFAVITSIMVLLIGIYAQRKISSKASPNTHSISS